MTFATRDERCSDCSDTPSPIDNPPNVPPDLEKSQTNATVSTAHKPSVNSTTPLTDESGPKVVKNLNRYQTALIFITNEVGIGILSLPSALHTLGLVPGLFAILLLGLLTTYTAYILIQFYRRYPQVMHIVDCCKVVGGRWAMWACGLAFVLNLALTCASALLTMSIALNTMSGHALCTVAFVAIPAIVSWLLCIPRKFKFIADFGIPCTISVIAAVLIVMISLGINGRPSTAPPGPLNKEIVMFGRPSFRDGLNACLNIAFAYAGNMAFISVMPEMANASKDFVPALIMLQGFAISMYALVGAFIYGFAGQYVTSPALGSAPTVPAKVAYGILLPCVLGTALVFGHTVTKYLFVEILRYLNWDDFSKNTRRSWLMWIGIGTVFWIVSFLLANAIPVFNSILGIIAAIFVSWYTFGIPSILWLHLNWRQQLLTKRKMALAAVNWSIIALTIFANIAGMWASIAGLLEVFGLFSTLHPATEMADGLLPTIGYEYSESENLSGYFSSPPYQS